MNDEILRSLQQRLSALERTAVRYRAGEVTDTSPLSVALGGSDVPYEDVRSIEANVDVGDQVAALVFGNDLVVLGRILAGNAWRSGSSTLTFSASTNSNTVFVGHGLGRTPTQVIATPHNAPAFGNIPTAHTANFTGSTFDLNGETKSSFTGTVQICWIAVG